MNHHLSGYLLNLLLKVVREGAGSVVTISLIIMMLDTIRPVRLIRRVAKGALRIRQEEEAVVAVDVLQLEASLEVGARDARLGVDDILAAAAAISESEPPDHFVFFLDSLDVGE